MTHSPILLGLPGAEILSFDDGPIHPCTYEETDSYQVTSMFINNREQILSCLLNEVSLIPETIDGIRKFTTVFAWKQYHIVGTLIM